MYIYLIFILTFLTCDSNVVRREAVSAFERDMNECHSVCIHNENSYTEKFIVFNDHIECHCNSGAIIRKGIKRKK